VNKVELVLIRGLPGSGKSTLAHSMMNHKHMETDMFWGPDYKFDIAKLKEAHEWCQIHTRGLLEEGLSVVVSNTFTTKKELQPYLEIAKDFGIKPQIITCHGQWKNVHNVPEEVLERMESRFEYDLTSLFE
jgi:predicted kinase